MKKPFTFLMSIFIVGSLYAQPTSIDVTDNYDFQQAVKYAVGNGVDTLFLSTPNGLYTTTDTSYFSITKPLVIMKKPGVEGTPTITHSDDSTSVLEIFRVVNDFTIDGVILDGGNAVSHGMKYAIRAGNGEYDYPLFKTSSDITVRNCVFKDFYQNKDIEAAGHGVYFLKDVVAGTVRIENCTFQNIGDEAIRMAETEKFATEKIADTLIVRNCTFTNIDAECVRFYGNTDTSDANDAYLFLENLTIYKSATRVIYVKNSRNTIAQNIIITDARLCGYDRSDRNSYSIQVQLKGSRVSNVDTLNMVYGAIHDINTIGATKKADGVFNLFSFDPLYADADNLDLTLAPSSPAFYSGTNNTHLGDLRWATATPTSSPVNMTIEGNGTVEFSPERLGLTFVTGTSVTITAIPDTGNQFVEWTGDLIGTDNPATITATGKKDITAIFSPSTDVDDDLSIPVEYSLNQNYPNPFNPSTTISFSLKQSGFTSLVVYDILGREIATLVNNQMNVGKYNIAFNASEISSGIYFYQIKSGDFSKTMKMMLLK
ncbi:MAG: T9SS type A sorting domain-containing protein [Bacteroidetes bacterium]|nr:T9SS type A sorting domain-containing protein [Bacteroidota bacterium]MBU1117030.1 T9SS type A sorting domain-containing protein [Bacteroidota bacterium]MBU1797625.1 T9SS type A sorting domain-containing protein [Bacteroidota bacterium]